MASAEPRHPAVVSHQDQLRVAPAHKQHQIRSLRWGISKHHRGQMALQVMNAEKGALMQRSKGATRHRGHHQSPGQTWSDRGRYGIQLPQSDTRLVNHGLHQPRQGLNVAARSDFGHNTTPTGMLLNLRCNPRRQNLDSPIRVTAQDRCSGLVTTCFEGKHCMHRSDAPPLLSDL